MTTPYRTDNAELTDFAKELGLRVLGCYHHPDSDRDTVFAKCPSCGKQGHYSGIEKVTKCGCDLKAHSLLKRDVEAIDKSSKEYRAWSKAINRISKNVRLVSHPTMRDFRAFIGELGGRPTETSALYIPQIPIQTDPDRFPLTVGSTKDCDLVMYWGKSRGADKLGRIGGGMPKAGRTYTDDNGVTKTARELGMSHALLRDRTTRDGWSDHDAMHVPKNWFFTSKHLKDEVTGESMSAPDWSRRTGIPKDVISQRVRRNNWSVHNAVTIPVDRSRNST